MKKLIISIIVFSIFGAFIYALYSGAMADVVITEREMGTYTLVFKKNVGSYSKIKPVMDAVYTQLKNDGIETTKGFGIYYDNPNKVADYMLRSDVGCIVETWQKKKLDAVKDKYNITQFHQPHCVVVEFPYKSQLSIILGVIKVYPQLLKYMESKKYKSSTSMEIYDLPAGKIYYIMPFEAPM